MSTPLDSTYWEEEEQALYEEMLPLMLAALVLGMDSGTETLPVNLQPLVNPSVFNQAAIDYAREYRYKYIKDITETTRKQTQDAMVNWLQSGQSIDVLEQTLAGIFGESRAARIAATETTRAVAEGNMVAWESTGFVESAEWMTAQDERVCPICAEREGSIIGIGDVDAAPPNSSHIGCRCWLQPIVSVEAVGREIDKVLE